MSENYPVFKRSPEQALESIESCLVARHAGFGRTPAVRRPV
jgi:hypothetical protein